MSLLKLTNYEGKPYSSGFSLPKITESEALNFLSFKEEDETSKDEVNQILIHVSIGYEKGGDYRVINHIDDESLEPALLLNPESYVDEGSEDLVKAINISSINYVFTGRIEFEMESGEIIPIGSLGYHFAAGEKEVIGRQDFEVLTTDLDHEEGEDIAFYPLGGFAEPGKDIKKIQPIFFRVVQRGCDTLLKTTTANQIKDVGGLGSLDGFMHEGHNYVFKSEAGMDHYQTLEDFIKSGSLRCTIGKEVEESAAAATAGGEEERALKIKSCEVYGSQPDDLVIGFKFTE